jgi:hypothetical protein
MGVEGGKEWSGVLNVTLDLNTEEGLIGARAFAFALMAHKDTERSGRNLLARIREVENDQRDTRPQD